MAESPSLEEDKSKQTLHFVTGFSGHGGICQRLDLKILGVFPNRNDFTIPCHLACPRDLGGQGQGTAVLSVP